MDETVIKMAVAAIMHDIGKFATEDRVHISEAYFRNNADLYLPFKDGRHSHRHALLTAAFIEQMADLLPAELNAAAWGQGDCFINLAAGHHRPGTPLQWIIAMADRISSGWDRVNFDAHYNHAVAWPDYQKTRLLALFEKLLSPPGKEPKSQADFNYVLPLCSLSPKTIFPRPRSEEVPADRKQAEGRYQELFANFVKDLGKLAHRGESLELWLDHFDSLLLRTTWAVPAARAGQVIPDVSLYDHLRTSAALAAALYIYHRDTDSLTEPAIKSEQESKFLMISGDFYGVQKFIFSDSGEARRNRSKILRGRSFAVSLFCELAADRLCRQLGLPQTAVVIQAGAKFVLIAPNLQATRDRVMTVEQEVNQWLTGISYGESAMGLAMVEAAPADFFSGRFLDLWERMGQALERKKLQKLNLEEAGGCFGSYLDGFHNDLRHPLCPFCGRRPSSPEVEGSSLVGEVGSACKVCRDHIMLGENLVKRNRIAITDATADLGGNGKKLLEPIFGRYQVAFVDGPLNHLARSGALLKYWNVAIGGADQTAVDATLKLVNGYVPTYGETDLQDPRVLATLKDPEERRTIEDQVAGRAPKTFEHIAGQALTVDADGQLYGNPALGVLKADVDQLGMIMACGLPRERFTLSRLATLSRSLNGFFALFLPDYLAVKPDYRDIYTVFAGGDDLFLIGPWRRMAQLAADLSAKFADFVGHNPELHFSAAITLAKPHMPLDRLAEEAEDALARSKEAGRNQITLFGATTTWAEYRQLQQQILPVLERWSRDPGISRGLLYRLNDFVAMAEREQQLRARRRVHLSEMECLKWRALFTYQVQRNIGRGLAKDQRQALQTEFEQVAEWLDRFGGTLRMALWQILYNARKRRS